MSATSKLFVSEISIRVSRFVEGWGVCDICWDVCVRGGEWWVIGVDWVGNGVKMVKLGEIM